MRDRREVIVYTDGSCNNNPKHKSVGFGGWAFIVIQNDILTHENLGFVTNTTSTQMEMVAVIEALKYCNKNFKNQTIKIHSDNAMVVNCFNERWYEKWQEVGWFNVKNAELWKKKLKLIDKKINLTRFIKVKGHSGIPENERVDFLAGEARKYILEQEGLL